MKNIFKKPRPVILTVEQLEAVLTLHTYSGSYDLKGIRYSMCGCGRPIVGSLKELRRHTAEEISALQK